MDPRTAKIFMAQLLQGGLLTTAGVTGGLWLPYGLSLAALGAIGARLLLLDVRTARGRAGRSHAVRTEGRALAALAWAVGAGVVLTGGVALTLAAGLAALGLALREADYFALGAANRCGGATPPRPRTGPEAPVAAAPRTRD